MPSGTIYLALLIVLVLALVGVYLINEYWVTSDAAEGSERIDRSDDDTAGLERVAWRHKHRQLPLEAKLVVAAVLLLAAGFSYVGYQLVKTGSPSTVQGIAVLRQVAAGLVVFLAGVYVRGRAEQRFRRAVIEVEDEDGEEVAEVKTVQFDARETRVEDGALVVRELLDVYWGLFPRRKLAAHDRQLRQDRPPSQYVERSLEPHRTELPDGDIHLRTQRERTVPGSADRPVDYEHEPPVHLDYAEYLRQREEQSRLHQRLESLRVRLAERDRTIDNLETIIKNREWETREDLMAILDRFDGALGGQTTQVAVDGDGRQARQAAAQQAASSDGQPARDGQQPQGGGR